MSPLRSEGSRNDQAGEAGPCYRGQESQNLLKGPLDLTPLRSSGCGDGHAGAKLMGYIFLFKTKDTQMRVGKQL